MSMFIKSSDGKKHLYGRDVWLSPEFKAFCERFGIPHDLRTLDMTIRITMEEMVVTQTYRGAEADPNKPVNTSNLHNKQWETKVPSPYVQEAETTDKPFTCLLPGDDKREGK